MRDIYSLNGKHRYNRMHHYQIRKNKEGLVTDIYDPETGKHYVPLRKSKRTEKLYGLKGRTAGYIVTEYYKGNIALVHVEDPNALKEEPF